MRGNRSGHVFAAIIDQRIYVRFVPLAADEVVEAELGICLRLIEATPEAPTLLSDEMRSAAFPG